MWEKILAVFSKDIVNAIKDGFKFVFDSIYHWNERRKLNKQIKKQNKMIDEEHKRIRDEYKKAPNRTPPVDFRK